MDMLSKSVPRWFNLSLLITPPSLSFPIHLINVSIFFWGEMQSSCQELNANLPVSLIKAQLESYLFHCSASQAQKTDLNYLNLNSLSEDAKISKSL